MPDPRPAEHTRPVSRPEAVLCKSELVSLLAAVETAYEAAWRLSDIGRIDFGPFEGLPRALRILRAKRDEAAA